MTTERVIQYLLTDRHYWLIEAMADGKVWFTIGEVKYLFFLPDVVKLSSDLLKLSQKASNILDSYLPLGKRQCLLIEANENDLLTAEICPATIAGNIIKIRSGTDFTLLLNRPQAEHLVYDLQKCLNNQQAPIAPTTQAIQ